MSEEERFDPRFDPAFQRGFDASAERARRANVTPSLTAEDVMYGRSVSPDFAAPPPPPPEDEADQVAAPVEEPSSPRDRHNPFVWALWLLSVVLIGGGIGFFMGPGRLPYSTGFANSPDPGIVALIQALYAICPAMITVGLGTISGLLFWHAAAWRRANR